MTDLTKQTTEAVKSALVRQAEVLKERAAWHKKHIDRGDRIIELKLESQRYHNAQLEAVHLALDALRDEHKRITQAENGKVAK